MNLDNLEDLLVELDRSDNNQAFELSKAIFLASREPEDIKATHPVIGQVRNGDRVPILDDTVDYGGFPFVEGCELPACEVDTNVSDYVWDIAEIGCKVKVCFKDFKSGFLRFFNDYRRMNEGDEQTAILQYIISLFNRNHLGAEARAGYFGDKSSDDDLINGFNGWVTQMMAGAEGDADLRVEVAENAEATSAEQTIADGERVYEILAEMYDKAVVQPWFDPSNMVWELNRENVNKLVGWLNRQSDLKGISCDCIDPEKVRNARVFTADNLSIFGIPVRPKEFNAMRKPIAELYDDADGTYENRNIFILAQESIMPIGYEHNDSLHQFDLGYNREDRYFYMNGSSMFGTAVATDHYIIGY